MYVTLRVCVCVCVCVRVPRLVRLWTKYLTYISFHLNSPVRYVYVNMEMLNELPIHPTRTAKASSFIHLFIS